MDNFLVHDMSKFNQPMYYKFVFDSINDNIDLVKGFNLKKYYRRFIEGIANGIDDLKLILNSNSNLKKGFKDFVFKYASAKLYDLVDSVDDGLKIKELRLQEKLRELYENENSIFDEKIMPAKIFSDEPMSFIDLISY